MAIGEGVVGRQPEGEEPGAGGGVRRPGTRSTVATSKEDTSTSSRPSPGPTPPAGEQGDQRVHRPRVGVLDLDVHQPAPADVEHRRELGDLGLRGPEVGRGSARRADRRACRRRGGRRARRRRCGGRRAPPRRRRDRPPRPWPGRCSPGASRLAPRCASTSMTPPCHLAADRAGRREIPGQPLARRSGRN